MEEYIILGIIYTLDFEHKEHAWAWFHQWSWTR